MGKKSESSLVLMFADVCESTRLYDTLGNDRAKALVSNCLGDLVVITARHAGQTVQTIGDEIFCAFPRPGDAIRAAGDMHVTARKLSRGDGSLSESLRLRIGLHYGTVLGGSGDYRGETRNTAARMAKLCKPDQILTTEPTVRALPKHLHGMTRYVDEHTMVGRLHKMDVYEVLWDAAEVTDVAIQAPPPSLRTVHTQLRLHLAGVTVEMNGANPVVSIGRDAQNELVVESALASRRHASIRLSRGRFVLTDQSVNGTYVRQSDGDEYSLRRDERPLAGSGEIGIGEPPTDNPYLAIAYVCE